MLPELKWAVGKCTLWRKTLKLVNAQFITDKNDYLKNSNANTLFIENPILPLTLSPSMISRVLFEKLLSDFFSFWISLLNIAAARVEWRLTYETDSKHCKSATTKKTRIIYSMTRLSNTWINILKFFEIQHKK